MTNSVSFLQTIYQENKEMQIEIEKNLLTWKEELDELKQEIYHHKLPQSDNQQFFSPIAAATYEKVKQLEEEQRKQEALIRENERQRDRIKKQNDLLREVVHSYKTKWTNEELIDKLQEAKNIVKDDPEKAEYLLNKIIDYIKE